MYDLKKIIIYGNFSKDDTNGIQVYVMKLDGLKIEKLLLVASNGFIGDDPESLKTELKGELYDDQYDEEDLKIKIKQVMDGSDAISKLTKFLCKNWSDECLVYYYNPDDKVFDKLTDKLHNTDNRVFISKYSDLVDESNKDIYTVMAEQGLKTENLIKDSQISFMYYLAALVEIFMGR